MNQPATDLRSLGGKMPVHLTCIIIIQDLDWSWYLTYCGCALQLDPLLQEVLGDGQTKVGGRRVQQGSLLLLIPNLASLGVRRMVVMMILTYLDIPVHHTVWLLNTRVTQLLSNTTLVIWLYLWSEYSSVRPSLRAPQPLFLQRNKIKTLPPSLPHSSLTSKLMPDCLGPLVSDWSYICNTECL